MSTQEIIARACSAPSHDLVHVVPWTPGHGCALAPALRSSSCDIYFAFVAPKLFLAACIGMFDDDICVLISILVWIAASISYSTGRFGMVDSMKHHYQEYKGVGPALFLSLLIDLFCLSYYVLFNPYDLAALETHWLYPVTISLVAVILMSQLFLAVRTCRTKVEADIVYSAYEVI